MGDYSTRQAAARLGISHSVLSKYIVTGKIPAPRAATAGGMTIHFWSDEDIERVRKLLPKIKNGRKTRYRKKQVTGNRQQAAEKQQLAISSQPTARRDLRQSAK